MLKSFNRKTDIKYVLQSSKIKYRRYVCESKRLGKGTYSRLYKGWICECSRESNEFFELDHSSWHL